MTAGRSVPLLLATSLLCVGLVSGFYVKTNDADVLWHLKTGEIIARTYSFPRQDPFSVTAAGAEWVGQEWLWELLLFLVWKAGGWHLVNVMKLLLVSSALGLAGAAGTMRGARSLSVLIACSLALCPLMAFPDARPQIFSYFMFGLLGVILQSVSRRGRLGVRIPPSCFIALPCLFALWSNVHAAFVIGFVLVAVHVAGESIDTFIGGGKLAFEGGNSTQRRSRSRRQPKRSGSPASVSGRLKASLQHPFMVWSLVSVVFSLFASMLNPFGWEPLLFSLRVVRHAFFRSHVYEWAPSQLTRPFWPFWTFLVIAAVLLVVGRRRASAGDWVALVVFGWMAISMRRQIAFFSLAMVPAMSVALGQLPGLGRTGVGRWLEGGLIAGTFLMLVFSFGCYRGIRSGFGAGLAPGRFPERATVLLSESRPGGNVFNDYNDGGYLIWRLWPDWKVSMDGRIDVYGPETVKAYAGVWAGAPGWRERLRQWHIDAILGRREVEKRMPKRNLYTELAASPEWRLIYEDSLSRLYLRKDAGESATVR